MNIWTLINWARFSIVEGEGGGAGENGGASDAGPEGAADAGAGGGNEPADGSRDNGPGAIDKAPGDGALGKDAVKDAGPKTMLEAIDRGLSKKADDGADGKKATDKPAAADHQGAKPKVDEKNELLKMPDGLSASGQKRFKDLVAENKTVSQQANEFKQKFEDVQGTLTEFQREMQRTGATPETLDIFFTYTEAVNGKRFEDAERVLIAQAKALQLAMGRPIKFESASPLADHADLQKEVDDLRISEERAMEIARGRDQSRRQELGQKARDEEHRRAQGQTQTRETAINEVQRWATERAAADIDYKAKEGKILAKLKTIAETYPPNLWLVRIKEAYADIGEIAPPAVTGNGKDNALRRGAGGGAGSPAPKTMQEAIAAGLGW